VLADGGRLFATWFLLVRARPTEPKAAFTFAPTSEAAWVADQALPEGAVAYELNWLRATLHKHGLRLREPINYGSWSGGRGASFQDIVVADKGTQGA
jgi:hypothetical protein